MLENLHQAQLSGDAELACREVYVIQEPEAEGESEGGPDTNAEERAPEGAEPESESGETEDGGEEASDCERSFAVVTDRLNAEVTNLSTEVGEIEIDGESATATVHTTLTRADGTELVRDVPYTLLSTPDGWRIRISDEG